MSEKLSTVIQLEKQFVVFSPASYRFRMAEKKREGKGSSLSEIEKIAIYRETLKSEKKFMRLNETFTPDVRGVQVLAENPMRRKPDYAERSADDLLGIDLRRSYSLLFNANIVVATVTQSLRDTQRIPSERSDFPLTAGQEIGFFLNVRHYYRQV